MSIQNPRTLIEAMARYELNPTADNKVVLKTIHKPGHDITLAQLERYADEYDAGSLHAYCVWNDANGDWKDAVDCICIKSSSAFVSCCNLCDGTGVRWVYCPCSVYIAIIREWFLDI